MSEASTRTTVLGRDIFFEYLVEMGIRVPWARAAGLVVGLAPVDGTSRLVMLRPEVVELHTAGNLAGEPRDDVACRDIQLAADDVVSAAPGVTPGRIRPPGSVEPRRRDVWRCRAGPGARDDAGQAT